MYVNHNTTASSLTIREGISPVLLSLFQKSLFPHYTWGYIDAGEKSTVCIAVPSLYVRVYRPICSYSPYIHSSLTIREGISMLSYVFFIKCAFPHYTWGYIGQPIVINNPARVPSLYVRVYRSIKIFLKLAQRSLTIREGISMLSYVFFIKCAFPHYTWGYIGQPIVINNPACVPSLYVRVYRKKGR